LTIVLLEAPRQACLAIFQTLRESIVGGVGSTGGSSSPFMIGSLLLLGEFERHATSEVEGNQPP
jgi:hypothetical protein